MNHKFYWFIVPLLAILLGSSFSYANNDKNTEQVILVVINQLSFNDKDIYKDITGFKNLENNSAKGAMNINSAGSRTDYNSYLTIGGGCRGVGINDEMGKSYMTNEIVEKDQFEAKDIYFQQTGNEITSNDNDAIIFLPINSLIKGNLQKFSFEFGNLGNILHEAGYNHRVYGNNDSFQINRMAPLITMNSKGISYGDVGVNTLEKDNTRPYGIKTNYSYLLKRWQEDMDTDVSLAVFDLGDLYRLEQFSEYMSAGQEIYTKQLILKEMGDFINYFFTNLQDNQTLIVASPMVNKEAINNKELLAPIWIYKKGHEGNILISNTTRREGVVANIDVAPTILNFLGIYNKPTTMIGEEIRIQKSKINLQNELNHIASIYNLRSTVLYNYILLLVIVLIIATFFWIKNYKRKSFWIKTVLINMLLLPIIMLFTAYLTPSNPYIYLLLILATGLIFSILLNFFKPNNIFLIIGAITFFAISMDIMLGSPLMKRSFLGYDPIIGARYYGIGNEYMGVYIGSTLLFVGALLQIKKNKLTIAVTFGLFLGLIILLFSPSLGTNFGGTIAALFATGISYYKFLNLQYQKKKIFIFSTIIFSTIAMLIIISLINLGENQTHIGKAISQISNGDISMVSQTIERKLQMNYKLIRVSIWSKVMLTSLVTLGILFIRPRHSIKTLIKEYQNIFYAFYGIITGAFIALLFNDSGIVAASTMILYLVIPLLYLALFEKYKRS